jgi:hypothetical protein
MGDKYEVDLEKSLFELKIAISSDSTHIPDFVNTRKANHKQCFSIFSYVLLDVDTICINKLISNNKILTKVAYIDSLYGDMSLIDEQVTIQYYIYFGKLLNYYASYCRDNELWEVLENIKNLYEGFFKIKLDFNYE